MTILLAVSFSDLHLALGVALPGQMKHSMQYQDWYAPEKKVHMHTFGGDCVENSSQSHIRIVILVAF